MSKTIHLPSPLVSGGTLCGRILSRNTPLTQRDQSTMATSLPALASGFAPASMKPVRVCRHCRRVTGELPPLMRQKHDPENEWLDEQEEEDEE